MQLISTVCCSWLWQSKFYCLRHLVIYLLSVKGFCQAYSCTRGRSLCLLSLFLSCWKMWSIVEVWVYFCWREMTPQATRAPAFPVALLPSSPDPVPLQIWNSCIIPRNGRRRMNSQAKVVSSSMYNNSTISNVPVVGGPINVEWENLFIWTRLYYRLNHWHRFKCRYKIVCFFTLRPHPQE